MRIRSFAFSVLAILGLVIIVLGLCRNLVLVDAAQRGDTGLVKLLLDVGTNPNTDDEGAHPLEVAVDGKHIPVIQLLISAGADINAEGPFHYTPLLCAATTNPQVISILLAHGADINAQDSHGDTALMIASENAELDVTLALLNAGANVNLKDDSGQTALLKAASIQYDVPASDLAGTVDALVSRGADVNVKDNQHQTASQLAERDGHPSIASLLKRAGAKH